MWKSFWMALSGDHGGRIIGALFGFFCGFLYLFAGFWDMLIFAFIVYIGYYVGSSVDRGQAPFEWRPLLEWLTARWRGFK